MSAEPIRGKVARILNSRELAINVGSIDGVMLGMQFDVLEATGVDIKDPDTGETLGSVRRAKIRVEVVKVQGRLSVASTFMKRVVNVGGLAALPEIHMGIYSRMLTPPKYVKRYETLKSTETTLEPLSEGESYVKLGDTVEQVLAEIGVEGADTAD